MANERIYHNEWLSTAGKRREMFRAGEVGATRYTGKKIFPRFVSDGICAFANEKGEKGMASHVFIVVDERDIPRKQLSKLKEKWTKKGYDINSDTVWIAESTVPMSRIAPLDVYMDVDHQCVIGDWKNLPIERNKTRRTLSRRAIKQIGRVYPVWHLGLYAIDKLTGWTGIGISKVIGKSTIAVCSKFVGEVCDIQSLRNRYMKIYPPEMRSQLRLGKTAAPGSVGVPVIESTPDDWYDDIFCNPRMFMRIFDTYKRIR